MKSLRILQTPVRFFPYIGGVENHVYYLSKELIKKGNSVEVLCADEPISSVKVIDAISVQRLKYFFKVTNTNICLNLPIKILKSNADLIHTHMPTPWSADWSVILAKVMNKKSLITIHNDMDKSSLTTKLLTKFYLYTLFNLTLSLVDRIIIVNPEWEKSFTATKTILEKYKHKLTIIPNGVDVNLFKPAKREQENLDKILFVSILDKHHNFKGLDYLLESIKIIRQANSRVKLIVVGEGELKIHFQKKARRLGIENNVKFIGEVKQNKLAYYYQRSALFVLPSTEIEGFGIVLLEAMASGLPVITTSITGVSKDIKKYKTGIVVREKNIQDLARAISKLLNNKILAVNMGKNGRKLIEKKYSWERIAGKTIAIYEK